MEILLRLSRVTILIRQSRIQIEPSMLPQGVACGADVGPGSLRFICCGQTTPPLRECRRCPQLLPIVLGMRPTIPFYK